MVLILLARPPRRQEGWATVRLLGEREVVLEDARVWQDGRSPVGREQDKGDTDRTCQRIEGSGCDVSRG